MKRRTHFELRAAMRETQVTQADLARAAGVSPITAWRWANAKIPIPGYVWSILALIDDDEAEAVLMGMPKEWVIEYDDVFPNGESFRKMVKNFHPDITRKDTNLEISIINEFKSFF